jgi:hypothetical protein
MNKKTILLFSLFTVMMLANCRSLNNSNSTEIPFTVGNGYFVKNTCFPGNYELIICSVEEFDTVFGVARTMNNRPTQIDFNKEFVLAVVGETTDFQTEIKPDNLLRQNDSIVFSYQKILGEKQTFSTRPCVFIVAGNENKGKIAFHRK